MKGAFIEFQKDSATTKKLFNTGILLLSKVIEYQSKDKQASIKKEITLWNQKQLLSYSYACFIDPNEYNFKPSNIERNKLWAGKVKGFFQHKLPQNDIFIVCGLAHLRGYTAKGSHSFMSF